MSHGYLEFPLDEILGSPALVRLSRLLFFEVQEPLGVMDAARLAGLSAPGARKALEHLTVLGVAARIGSGRALKYGPRMDHPFAGPLRVLFELESERHEDLLQGLRNAVSIPEVRVAWLHPLPAEPGIAVEMGIEVEAGALGRIDRELRTRLLDIETRHDLTIETALFTRADKPVIPESATILWGLDSRMNGLARLGSPGRSSKSARVIADMIRRDPTLVRRALRHVNRLLLEGQGPADADIGEWRELLQTYPPDRLRDLLVSRSPRAERLRRSMPFPAVLTPGERDALLEGIERVEDED